MNLAELIEQLEDIRKERGDGIQVVLRTKNPDDSKCWCYNFTIQQMDEDGYTGEVFIQNFV